MLKLLASIVDTVPGAYEPTADLEHQITSFALDTVMYSAVALVILVVIAAFIRNRVPALKMPVFVLMSLVMAGSAVALIGSTVYLNVKSESGGPIHWHADIEYWTCGNQLELRNPTGFLSNKIGTSVLHEHDDQRIHLEGVAVDKSQDASIGKFMHVVGGIITDDNLIVPLNEDGNTFEDEVDGDGRNDLHPELVEPYIFTDPEQGRVAAFQTGGSCGDQEAEVQTFVYRYNDDDTYEQFKLDKTETLAMFGIGEVDDYAINENPNVPPGDCVIFEFDVPKEKTDKLCQQYGVRDIERCEEFGVEPDQREICTSRQVNYDPDTDYTIRNEVSTVTEELPTSNTCLRPEEPDPDFECDDTTNQDELPSGPDNDTSDSDDSGTNDGVNPDEPVSNQEDADA